MAGLLDVKRFPGIWGDPVPRVVGGAPPMATLPNRMNELPIPNRPTPAAPASLMDRVGTGLGTLFGGADDPNLSPEQNRAARQQAMLQAGLQTILASENGGSGLAAIAQGALAGQGAGAQAREMAYMSTQEERLKQALSDPAVVGNLSPQQLAMIRLMPPTEAAKALSALAFAPAPEAKVVGDALIGADGTVIYEGTKGPDLPSDLEAVLWASGVDPATMTPELRTQALAKYEEMKRAGATNINVNGERRQDFADTNALGGQFRQDIADYQAIADSYAAIRTAASDPSPAGDIGIIFGYMKMLDPTSVVREGEQATARNAGSIPERVRAQYNRALNGEQFTPAQRADFVNQARQRAEQKRNQMKPILNRYRSRAEAGGVNPGMVVYDPFEEIGLGSSSPDDPFGDL